METRTTSPASAAEFKMIDIGAKTDTERRAVASGAFIARASTIARLRERSLPKGDALMLAEVAGIQGAKRAAELLPLCHPLSLTSVRVWMEPETEQIRVFCEVRTVGKTGVEMEALCGVNAALLCIYDLTKGIDPVLGIGEIRLDLKEGGKSGHWVNPNIAESPTPEKSDLSLEGMKASVITLSDRSSRGESEDLSGPAACTWLRERGVAVAGAVVLPDDCDALTRALESMLRSEGAPDLIITSGGTGLSRRDITPETVLAWAWERGGREVPGIGELLRQAGSRHTRSAWLSRSIGVWIEETLIVCLPGKPSAVTEGLEAIGSLLRHAIHVGGGGGHE